MLIRFCQLLALLCPFLLIGQTPCDDYDLVIRQAREKLNDLDNLDANFVYSKLRTARLKSQDCASSNPTRQFFPEIDDILQELFSILETQNTAAIRAKETAQQRSRQLARQSEILEKEKERADSLRSIAEIQNQQLLEQAAALRITLSQLRASEEAALIEKERAEAVLNRIYFYNNNYGLATNGDPIEPKYGYINKELTTLIPFEYDEALPFDNSGFARVRKGNKALLINTEAEEFRLAENLDQLNATISALDLRRLLDRRRAGPRRRSDLSGNSNLVITETVPPLVGNFRNLRIILANRGQLTDISNLAPIEKIKELQLSQNEISDLKPLSKMGQLRHLRLDGNEIEEIQTLGKLRSLVTLNLYGNNINNFSPLTGLTSLEWLNLGRNKIKRYLLSLNLPSLRYLNLDGNRLTSASGVHNLNSLIELSIANNFLRDLTGIDTLRQLESLNLADNKLRSIDGLASLDKLKQLNVSGNQIEDLSPLANLLDIEILNLGENTGIRTIAPLLALTKLRSLDISKCRNIPLEEVDALRNQLPNCKIIE